MWLVILALAAAQFLDFATFVAMFARHGLAAEANPLVADAVTRYGIWVLAALKLALVALLMAIAAILLSRSKTEQRLAVVLLALGIAGGLVGGLSNTLTLL